MQDQKKTSGADRVKNFLRPMLTPLLAILTALLIGAIVMLLSGDNPLLAYYGLLWGAVGSGLGWAKTIRKMTPEGRTHAFKLKLGERERELVRRAGLPDIAGSDAE